MSDRKKEQAVERALTEGYEKYYRLAYSYVHNEADALDMVQEANFRYYWEGAEPNSGLARENIPGRNDMIATGASGFGIMAMFFSLGKRAYSVS